MTYSFRILTVDDTPSIHHDYRSILMPRRDARVDDLEEEVFGPRAARTPPPALFEVDHAHQGRQALEMARAASVEGRPYALAYVDVRMPPGWDGIETVSRIWEVCPDLEVVIATAYSDRTLDDILSKLTRRDRFLILKKPFDSIVVLQLAYSLTEKWRLRQDLLSAIDRAGAMMAERVRRFDTPADGIPAVSDLRTARQVFAEATAAMRKISRDMRGGGE